MADQYIEDVNNNEPFEDKDPALEHFGQPVQPPIRWLIPRRFAALKKESLALRRTLMIIIQLLMGSAVKSQKGIQVFPVFPRAPRQPDGTRPEFDTQKYENISRDEWIQKVTLFYQRAFPPSNNYQSLRNLFGWKYHMFKRLMEGLLNLIDSNIWPQVEQLDVELNQYRTDSLEIDERSANIFDLTERWRNCRLVLDNVRMYVKGLVKHLNDIRPKLDPSSWKGSDDEQRELMKTRWTKEQRDEIVEWFHERLSRIYWWARPLDMMVPLGEFLDVEEELWLDQPVEE